MTQRGTVYLMYHELELPGRPLCRPEEGYKRYCVPDSNFRSQLRYLLRAGLRGMSVSEALDSSAPEGVVITFDDGCETNLISAAPLLKQANFGATFYITLSFIGRRGFLSPAQLRELSDCGFDIGCHSRSHSYLTDLSADSLHKEIAEAKTELEQMIGRRVEHFSCPGGRWNQQVAEVAREAGYRSVATSRIATNSIRTNPFNLARVVIMHSTSLAAFARLCRGHGLWPRQLRGAIRGTAMRLLGDSVYDRIRGICMERGRRPGTDKVTPEPGSERFG
jgi:peptidoglycan/xylan/chitin deacetylase (PgdA/CDA1 family)